MLNLPSWSVSSYLDKTTPQGSLISSCRRGPLLLFMSRIHLDVQHAPDQLPQLPPVNLSAGHRLAINGGPHASSAHSVQPKFYSRMNFQFETSAPDKGTPISDAPLPSSFTSPGLPEPFRVSGPDRPSCYSNPARPRKPFRAQQVSVW